jgi:hypothetical protein
MVRPFQWKKLGRIFAPDGRLPWMKHYAQVPTPVVLDDRIRIFFTCRPDPDEHGDFVSFTTFLDVALGDPTRILYVHDEPVLPLGEIGTFDQFGVMPCSVVRRRSDLWLYYVGWARSRGVPWQSAIGLAISSDNGRTFRRYAKGPIVSRTPLEPYVQGSPCVLELGKTQHLWYLSGTRWVENSGRVESIYRLMHATSADGIEWSRNGIECIPSLQDDECQARPAVVVEGDVAHMWFSYRHGVDFRNPERGYGIGYAYSNDLITWLRRDDWAGISKSADGWDSEMISYPSIVKIDQRYFMFYCGNQMGRDGFGVAVSE